LDGGNSVDYKTRQGQLREVAPRELPSEFGSEVSGVVEAVGQDVEGFSVGDEVFGYPAPGHGAFSEYTVTSAVGTARKPTHLSFHDAATLPVAGATAWDGIVQLALTEGQTLLINGIGGGVGVAAAQIARDAGIAVFGTASEEQRALVESLGAVLVPYGDGVEQRVRALLPDGVDGILDLVGEDALRSVAGLVKNPGKLVTTADPPTAEALGGAAVQRDRTSRVLDEVARLVADGKLDPHVNDVLAFDDAQHALPRWSQVTHWARSSCRSPDRTPPARPLGGGGPQRAIRSPRVPPALPLLLGCAQCPPGGRAAVE